MKKLQNYFNDFLPMEYTAFKRGINDLASNPAVVAELLRVGCEETASNGGIKAIQMAFERILGKPEKVIVIKRTITRMLYPEASEKALEPPTIATDDDAIPTALDNKVVVDEPDSPGYILKQELDKVGYKGRAYAYEVVDSPHGHPVSEVLVCNLYALAMAGGNLSAIDLLFNYLDGAVADVIRIDGLDTILLENYAQTAPYDAIRGDDGVYYIDMETIR